MSTITLIRVLVDCLLTLYCDAPPTENILTTRISLQLHVKKSTRLQSI